MADPADKQLSDDASSSFEDGSMWNSQTRSNTGYAVDTKCERVEDCIYSNHLINCLSQKIFHCLTASDYQKSKKLT